MDLEEMFRVFHTRRGSIAHHARAYVPGIQKQRQAAKGDPTVAHTTRPPTQPLYKGPLQRACVAVCVPPPNTHTPRTHMHPHAPTHPRTYTHTCSSTAQRANNHPSTMVCSNCRNCTALDRYPRGMGKGGRDGRTDGQRDAGGDGRESEGEWESEEASGSSPPRIS